MNLLVNNNKLSFTFSLDEMINAGYDYVRMPSDSLFNFINACIGKMVREFVNWPMTIEKYPGGFVVEGNLIPSRLLNITFECLDDVVAFAHIITDRDAMLLKGDRSFVLECELSMQDRLLADDFCTELPLEGDFEVFMTDAVRKMKRVKL